MAFGRERDGLHFFGQKLAKTTGNLFDRITSLENLYESYLAARKGKRGCPEVDLFSANLEINLLEIHEQLVNKTWRTSPARCFRVFEPKQRDIQAPPFQDRVVHHALVRVVEPFFDRKFIHHSYACRKGKGSQRAVWSLQSMIRDAKKESDTVYIIKCDISKYFSSINHAVLFSEISKTISCARTLLLWLTITQGYGHSNGIGIPVGALTSQLDGNIQLSPFDHLITSGAGFGRYVRFMDDFVIVVNSKEAARSLFSYIDERVQKLDLKLNPKSEYFPVNRGVDFAGYRIWSTHILPRKRNIKKASKRFKLLKKQFARGQIDLSYIQPRVASFLGYTKHCMAHRTVENILSQFTLQREANEYHNREPQTIN